MISGALPQTVRYIDHPPRRSSDKLSTSAASCPGNCANIDTDVIGVPYTTTAN